MGTPAVCPSCGARSPRLDARSCSSCGHGLPRAEPPAPPPGGEDAAACFERLRGHSDFALLMQHRPSIVRRRIGAAAIVLFVVALLALAAILMLSATRFPQMIAPSLALLGAGVFVFVSAVRSNPALRREALVRVPARVADVRVEVLLGDGVIDGTSYFVSLEGERGGCAEYEVDGQVAGRVAQGDVGVAYFKGPLLVDFRRPGA